MYDFLAQQNIILSKLNCLSQIQASVSKFRTDLISPILTCKEVADNWAASMQSIKRFSDQFEARFSTDIAVPLIGLADSIRKAQEPFINIHLSCLAASNQINSIAAFIEKSTWETVPPSLYSRGLQALDVAASFADKYDNESCTQAVKTCEEVKLRKKWVRSDILSALGVLLAIIALLFQIADRKSEEIARESARLQNEAIISQNDRQATIEERKVQGLEEIEHDIKIIAGEVEAIKSILDELSELDEDGGELGENEAELGENIEKP